MKKTEEINEKDVLVIISNEDAREFKNLANGRKFCKRGQRIKDISKEEIDRRDYKKLGFFSKLFHKKCFKKKNEFLLENRLTSNVRAIAMYLISLEENENINEEELEAQIKRFILEKVEKYSSSKKNKE